MVVYQRYCCICMSIFIFHTYIIICVYLQYLHTHHFIFVLSISHLKEWAFRTFNYCKIYFTIFIYITIITSVNCSIFNKFYLLKQKNQLYIDSNFLIYDNYRPIDLSPSILQLDYLFLLRLLLQ